jgi:hypothetical protein
VGAGPDGDFVLRKVRAAGEEGSMGTAASHANLVTFLQAAAEAAELRETEATLDSQAHSDEVATHGFDATLSGKDKKIARLEALRGANEEVGGGASGAREEAAGEMDELKCESRKEEASEAPLMAASRDCAREDSQTQS